MTVTRYETSPVYSKVTEANGFVFTAGVIPTDLSKDVEGQTAEVLAEIDRLLALAGTNKSKVVQATVWLNDIRHRDGMNKAWSAWLDGRVRPQEPASKPRSSIRKCSSRFRSSPSSRTSKNSEYGTRLCCRSAPRRLCASAGNLCSDCLSRRILSHEVDNATRTSLNLRNTMRGDRAPIVFGDAKQ